MVISDGQKLTKKLSTNSLTNFFSARCTIHSAKRVLAIACRLSVRPSVTLVICDHIRWKSWKPIARVISPTPSLLATKRLSTYSQGNMGKFGETRGGVGKMAFWRTKATIYLKRIKIEERLTFRYRLYVF